MNLLLLLSALLSALTGVGASARAPEPAPAVSRSVPVAQVAVAAERLVAARPVFELPALGAIARLAEPRAIAAIIGAPLFMSRRRE